MPSNGEVEGPRRSARSEPRGHTVFAHPRRHYRLSRTPPTIVRSPATTSSKSPANDAPGFEALPHEWNDPPGNRAVKASEGKKVEYDSQNAVIAQYEDYGAEEAKRTVPDCIEREQWRRDDDLRSNAAPSDQRMHPRRFWGLEFAAPVNGSEPDSLHGIAKVMRN